jgi:hypothetical protein
LPTQAELKAEQPKLRLANKSGWEAENLSVRPISERHGLPARPGIVIWGCRLKWLSLPVKDDWWDNPLAMYQLSVYFHDPPMAN